MVYQYHMIFHNTKNKVKLGKAVHDGAVIIREFKIRKIYSFRMRKIYIACTLSNPGIQWFGNLATLKHSNLHSLAMIGKVGA